MLVVQSLILFCALAIRHSSKSAAAAKAAQKINSALRVRQLQNRVSPDSEDVFDDAFWSELGMVVNALDNVNARLYVDSRCVYFAKPLLESGTLGPKCNTQMVIPRLTENYGAHWRVVEAAAHFRHGWSSEACTAVLEACDICLCDCAKIVKTSQEASYLNKVSLNVIPIQKAITCLLLVFKCLGLSLRRI